MSTAILLAFAFSNANFPFPSIGALQAAQTGELDLTVLDAESKEPIAVRLRIVNSRGRTPRIRNTPRLGNDFTFKNLLSFKLRKGKYQFSIDRGPHYHQRTGILEVDRDGFDQKTLLLPRFVDMRREGWYGGDLLVQREPEELALLLDAEELDVACAPSWAAGVPMTELQQHRPREVVSYETSLADLSCGLALTDGGRLLAANISIPPEPTEIMGDALGFATALKNRQAHVSVLEPTAKDLPMLVAHDMVDSIVILPDGLQAEDDQAVSLSRRASKHNFEGLHGLGRYCQYIYFQLLNSGLRIPPAAASGSGSNKSPPGYNRVYVACGSDFSRETWWRNLGKGRSIVSNGPVLRVRAKDQLPGHVFPGVPGNRVQIDVTCNLGTRQKVEYLELIKNGRVVNSVRLDKWAAANGRLPVVEFEDSGWLVVRAHAPGEPNYRVAMSAPFYVEFGGRPRVSEASVQFFLDWVYDRARELRRSNLPEDQMRRRVAEQRVARDFWSALMEQANAP